MTKNPRGDEKIEEKEIKRLKKILLAIASADAGEVIELGKQRLDGGNGEIKLSRELSMAVSSMKLKANSESLEVDIKLCDKLKAIELYFKLVGESERDASDGTLYIDYDYRSPKEVEDED